MPFSMKFRLPPGLVGERVVLQWKYVTANSCNPIGYETYAFPAADWHNPGLPSCVNPLPETTGSTPPEQFWNCADVTITASEGDRPPSTAPSDEPSSQPVSAPIEVPTPSPTLVPALPPSPPSEGTCCYWPIDESACTVGCNSGSIATGWCAESEAQCLNCAGKWCGVSAVPAPPTPVPSASAPTPPVPNPEAYCCYWPNDESACSVGCGPGSLATGWCAESEERCLNCAGKWCGAV